MDVLNLIRSGIFLTGGLVSIIFHRKLNNWKNHILKKLKLKRKVKDERKDYIHIGIGFIIISIGLFIYAITH